MLQQLLVNGFILGSVYSMMALGFALIYNTTHIFHIAYAGVYIVSPYLFMACVAMVGLNPVLSFVIALLLSVIVSLSIERIAYYPLEKRRSPSTVIMISSLACMTIIINVIAMIFGNETKIINSSISGSLVINDLIITRPQYIQLSVSLFIIAGIIALINRTGIGIATRALSNNKLLCQVMGLKVYRFRLLLFALSGFIAAVGGLLIAYDVGIDPYVGMSMLLVSIVAVIIGGVGNFYGPILGGFILGILQALTIGFFSSRWQNVVTFALLIIFLLLRPQGLLGEKQRMA